MFTPWIPPPQWLGPKHGMRWGHDQNVRGRYKNDCRHVQIMHIFNHIGALVPPQPVPMTHIGLFPMFTTCICHIHLDHTKVWSTTRA